MFQKKKIKAQNSRRFKRLRAEYLMKYQLPGVQEEPKLSNMKDLSAGGVKFWTENYIPEGTLIKVGILLPPLQLSAETLGRVVRVRQAKEAQVFYTAVRFIEISENAKQAINTFIEDLSAQPETKQYVSGSPLVQRTVLA